MNKEELVQEISKKSKVTQKEANEVLSALIETVQKTVSKGKKVTLVGFGTFEPRKRAARNGRNPQTGKEIKIPAKTVPAFSAGKKFKEAVNGKSSITSFNGFSADGTLKCSVRIFVTFLDKLLLTSLSILIVIRYY